jgi:glucose/mannose transport system permease protein
MSSEALTREARRLEGAGGVDARRKNAARLATGEPQGRRPHRVTVGRIGVYAFLLTAALFFFLPLWIMVLTSLKPMSEIRLGNILAWPDAPSFDAWVTAWFSACTGLECNGIRTGFWNSVRILIPSVILSIAVGAVNGYALSLWRVRGANILFAVLLVGAFVPYQVFLFPLVRIFSQAGINNSLPCIVLVHVIFGLPTMTLLFRNYYAGLPIELFKAARIDGGGFWSIFLRVMLPMSTPMLVVATILQVTGIWNDFIFGLTFAGSENRPMTVQLNNIVNSTQGERLYNVDMAATILAAMVPLVVYFISGRWFVRGIAAGALKG